MRLKADDLIRVLLYAKRGYPQTEIAAAFGVSPQTVMRIVNGKSHKRLHARYYLGDADPGVNLLPLSNLTPRVAADSFTKQRQRVQAEQREAEQLAEAERVQAQREAEQLAEAERVQAQREAEQLAEAERVQAQREAEQLAEAERVQAQREAEQLAEAERVQAQREAEQLAEAERVQAQREAEQLAEAERVQAQTAEQLAAIARTRTALAAHSPETRQREAKRGWLKRLLPWH